MTATSKISPAGGAQAAGDVLLPGAAGNSGRVIAAGLAARGLPLRLAGRRRGPLEDLAAALAAAGARAGVRAVDAGDTGSLAGAVAGAGVVVPAAGPFARLAGPVTDACLAAGVPYAGIASEWPAVLAGAGLGAWTPGSLFGAGLVSDATGARVSLSGQPG